MSTTVRNFDGSTVNDLHGMFTVMVSHGGRQTDANLYIVANNLPSVAGRDLIQALGLRINGESLTVRVCVAENNQTSNNILSNFPVFCWMTALTHIRDINTSPHFLMTSSHTPPKYDRCLSPNATQSWQKSKAWWTTAFGHQWTNRNVRTPWLPLTKKTVASE